MKGNSYDRVWSVSEDIELAVLGESNANHVTDSSLKTNWKTRDVMTADDMTNICKKVKLLEHFAGLYTAIVMCPYCSQHTANFAPCCKCGAPVGDTSIENDETPSQRRKRLLGE